VIPRPFEYERPASVDEAVALLTRPVDVSVLAGGQSLVPMMSLGLARPELVVDIGELELEGIDVADGRIRVGARTTHRELELAARARELVPLAAEAARHIGNPRVRNRGTFGGSLAHADPAAELGAVVLVHGGDVVVRGAAGERRIGMEEFFLGYLETGLGDGELVVAAELERLPEGSGIGFEEAAGRADDFATAAAAAVVRLDDGGRECAEARIALAGVADRPLRVPQAEEAARGEPFGDELLRRVQAAVEEAVEPEEDAFVSASFRKRLAGVCARRALEQAWTTAA
jgi:aerobic carbon-monoxide dehydrogenase medium subunit